MFSEKFARIQMAVKLIIYHSGFKVVVFIFLILLPFLHKQNLFMYNYYCVCFQRNRNKRTLVYFTRDIIVNR